MHTITGLRFLETLHEDETTTLRRATREADPSSILVRTLHGPTPRGRESSTLLHELTVLRDLDVPGIVRPLAIEGLPDAEALLLEDPGGRPLSQILREGRLSIEEVLRIGITMATTLDGVHGHGLIHGDIAPHHVLFDRQTSRVHLTGFGFATRHGREAPRVMSLSSSEGALHYVSPEQTGRMNRGVDQRTDLYSLGVTLYEALTQHPPFSGTATEIVHGHIARRPPPPDQEDGRIPATVSRIIMKLLEKNAEDRYQSAEGLRADLSTCESHLAEGSRIPPFPLGRHDEPETLHIPEKLYGRKSEERALAEALHRAAESAVELVVVSGWAGIGKTALVNEMAARTVRLGGRFAAGKFDQFNRSAPLAAVIEATRDLARQLLGERSEQLAEQKARIAAAVGQNGALLLPLVPELSFVLGDLPSVPPLGGAEAQNRFFTVLSRFLYTFASPDKPLVLFLDDMQWADTSSLKLLSSIFSDPSASHLLVIGAQRDNEVDPSHPWVLACDEIKRGKRTTTRISLGPLSQADVAEIVEDALSAAGEDTLPLARLVFERTQGNPFYIRQLLRAFHEEGILWFDIEAGGFTYDLEAARDAPPALSVVDFMATRIALLPEDVREVLELGAMIGYKFDFKTLATIHAKGEAETSEALSRALDLGLVLPEGGGYRFLHDRVQQAAYSLVDEATRPRIHLRIGRLLAGDTDPNALGDLSFDIARHLGLGAGPITDPSERARAAAIGLVAGQRARAASAYEAALGYFRKAMELLPENAWDHHYETTFALYKERAETEVLTGHFAEASALYPEAKERARDALHQVAILSVEASHAQLEGRYADTMRAQLHGLSRLGWKLPDEDNERRERLSAVMAEVMATVSERGTEALLSAPKMQDRAQIAAMELAQGLFYAAYLANEKPLAFLVAAEMTRASLLHGNASLSPFAYVGYGMVTGLLGDHENGQRIARIGIELAPQFDNPAIHCVANYVYAADVHSWAMPLREVDPYYDRTYDAGLASGDWISIGYMIINSNCDRLTRGDPLADVLARSLSHCAFLERAKNQTAIDLLHAGVIQPIRALMGETASPCSFDGEGFTERGYLDEYGRFAYHTAWLDYARIRHAFLFDQQDRFAALWGQLALVESALPTHANKVPETNLYVGLMRARLASAAPADERAVHLAEVARIEAKLLHWSKSAPANVRHKLLLLQAERARVEERVVAAMALYEQAIAAAREAGYVNNEALGNELYGRFWFDQGRAEIAGLYFRKAARSYESWGALAKATSLAALHPELFVGDPGMPAADGARAAPSESPSAAESMDWMTVLRAGQVIAREVVLSGVLSRVMEIVVQSAGATMAGIVLARESGLVLAARMSVDPDVIEIGSSTLLEERVDLATSVVVYAARTHETVALSAPIEDGRFLLDPYLARKAPRSLLAVPLTSGGRLLGVLYLENRLTAGAFGRARTELCQLIAGQAAIAVENALLYADVEAMAETLRKTNEGLEREVLQRTDELTTANQRLLDELAERERIEQARADLQDQIIRMQEAKLAELGAPLIPIASDVAVMPLLGVLDQIRAEQVLSVALSGARTRGTRAIIFDVTGVREIQAEAVATMFNTVNALRLLGTQAIITGVRADMARKMMDLGMDLSHVPIRATLEGGIALVRRDGPGRRVR